VKTKRAKLKKRVYGPRFTKETNSEVTVALYIWLKYMNGIY
jgi:hypothetical protein